MEKGLLLRVERLSQAPLATFRERQVRPRGEEGPWQGSKEAASRWEEGGRQNEHEEKKRRTGQHVTFDSLCS